MAESVLKVHFVSKDQRINFFMPKAEIFQTFKVYIEDYLFNVNKVGKCELDFCYHDKYNEEVNIANDFDLKILNTKSVTDVIARPKNSGPPKSTNSAPSEDDPSNFVIHDGVECDGCGVNPLVGFRYKCIECPNFDLCQRCESEHKHSEHMFMRMPNPNCPSFVEAHITPPGVRFGHKRRGSKHASSSRPTSCPFMAASGNASGGAGDASNKNKEQSSSSRHHDRKQHRRMKLFTHFYDMMQDLAEGGVTAVPRSNETATADVNAKNEGKSAQQETSPMAKVEAEIAAAAAKAAQKSAAQAAEIAANIAPLLAATCPFKPPTPQAEKPEEKKSDSNQTQTPPTTPDSTASNMPTPLENLTQYIDPQYMKVGIDILNNFSEMFAKMLDPQANGEAGEETSNENSMETDTESNANVNAEPQAAAANNETPKSRSASVESNKSSDAEGDWQMIDDRKETQGENSNEATPSGSSTSAAAMNYEQLSKDLKAHVEEEKRKEEAQKLENKTTTDAAVNTINPSPTPAARAASAATPTLPPRPEEKRAIPIFHTNKRINDAILAMMGMGFSNEGAYLTQLLETVDGDIAKALDIITAQNASLNNSR